MRSGVVGFEVGDEDAEAVEEEERRDDEEVEEGGDDEGLSEEGSAAGDKPEGEEPGEDGDGGEGVTGREGFCGHVVVVQLVVGLDGEEVESVGDVKPLK